VSSSSKPISCKALNGRREASQAGTLDKKILSGL
jgi:hypothetical protein